MPSARKWSLLVPSTVMLTVTFGAVYAFAYYRWVGVMPGDSRPYYRVGVNPDGHPSFSRRSVWTSLFAPIHAVDRFLRPQLWRTRP